LRRLLVILVDNAVQHTPANASIRVVIRDEQEVVVLSVVDTGQGITSEHLSRIFDRFYRVDPSRNRSKGGFGLGLSIAKWIVDYHQGTITATSEVGNGTTLSVRLSRLGRPPTK